MHPSWPTSPTGFWPIIPEWDGTSTTLVTPARFFSRYPVAVEKR